MKKLLIIFLCWPVICFSQQKMIPELMIIPYGSLEKYESNIDNKVVISAIEALFSTKGFKLSSVNEEIAQINQERISWNGNFRDYAIQRVESEILVEVDFSFSNINDGVMLNISKINIINGATMKVLYRGIPLNSGIESSGSNWLKIVTELMNPRIDNFCKEIHKSYENMIEKGKPMRVIIQKNNQSKFSLDDRLSDNSRTIKELIIEWVKDNAQNNVADYDDESITSEDVTKYLDKHMKAISRDGANVEVVLKWDIVRIPYKILRKGEERNGDKYFARDLRKSIAKICMLSVDGEKVKPPRYFMSSRQIIITMP